MTAILPIAPGRGLGVEMGGRTVAPTGVVHVGGHHGEEALYYEANGARTVVWIEAEPDAFEVLERRVAHRPGHHCIHALAADQDGEERTFYRHRFPGGSKRGFCSTLPWNPSAVAGDPMLSRLETFDVRAMRAVTVATALRERGFAPGEFQYLSINVQGAELLVLRGMGEYLAAIQWIFCDGELDGESRYEGAPSVRDLAQWLRPHGFRPAGAASSRLQFFYRGERDMATIDVPRTTTAGLDLFLGGFDRDLFFDRHWERRSLHLRHDDPGRFAHLISPESFFDREVKGCQHLKASTRDASGWNVEVRIQPEQAEKMFRAGMTICASVLDEQGPAGQVIEAYRAAITTAAPPHVNCYYSPDQRGYGLHFDTHPVWILQVAGSKHWTVSYEPAVVNPPFNVIFPPGRDRVALPWITLDRPDVSDRERFMEVRLDPGDVLYIPAGGWHAARAEGASLALTLALGRIGTLELLEFLVSQAAHRHLRDVTARLSPLPRLAGNGSHRGELRARIESDLARLKGLVQRIDADDLLEVYESLADHPEAVLASRQFVAAKEQVTMMKSQYAAGREEK